MKWASRFFMNVFTWWADADAMGLRPRQFGRDWRTRSEGMSNSFVTDEQKFLPMELLKNIEKLHFID